MYSNNFEKLHKTNELYKICIKYSKWNTLKLQKCAKRINLTSIKRSYTNRVRHESKWRKKNFSFSRWILIARITLNRAIHHRFNLVPTYRLAWRNRQEKNKRIHRSELSNSRDGFVVEVHFRYARRERGTNARLY